MARAHGRRASRPLGPACTRPCLDRNLRRFVLLGHAAYQRNRHSHGARRSIETSPEAGPPPRHAPRRSWRTRGSSDRPADHTARVNAALRRQRLGPRYLHLHHASADGRRFLSVLRPRAPRHTHRSTGSPALRVTTWPNRLSSEAGKAEPRENGPFPVDFWTRRHVALTRPGRSRPPRPH